MRIQLSLIAMLTLLTLDCSSPKLNYPKTEKVNQVDNYFGTEVRDDYRWLEDDTSEATAKWVEAQNKVTFGYLEKIPFRNALKARLTEIYNYPKYSAPFRKGDYFFFYKNDGLQNQSVLYIQKGLDGTPEVLLDPNTFSEDGTSRLGAFAVSKDAKYAAYGISKGGSDWQTYYVMELATKKQLPDTLNWVKVSGIAWEGDGFYYSRYPEPSDKKELSAKNEFHQVYYHKVGTPQSQDELVFEDKAHPQRFHFAFTSEDEQFTFLSISDRGTGKQGNALYFKRRGEKNFKPIVSEITDFSYSIVDNVGDDFLITTNHDAPNEKVMRCSSKNPDMKNWQTVIAEKPEALQYVTTGGGKIFALYMKDVSTRVYVHALDGTFENEVELPALGTASGFSGEADDKFVFYTFTSFTFPPTIYRYDIASKTSTVFRKPELKFNPEDYETKQVFFTSKDGTKVPMFLVYKKGIVQDGNNPTLMYGYGGFNVSLLPSFNPLNIALLEQGVIYAQVNLRGGNEYGEAWHQAGMKFNKQNVFDDFIAGAEYLIKEKYTCSEKLAMRGGSNGGLLVGAVMCQRPELFKVALPAVGVMDMLRFQKFTIGWNWIAEYGSSEASKEEFEYLYRYSPLHNLKEGVSYPATLITTADHDDRVVPAHSFKFAAALQEKHRGENPVLIRIAVKSGHGASSTEKAIEETTDVYAFLFYNLGITPKFNDKN
ncbi:MAG: prolyl oligopeptidase family serine peptidase [Chloroherpetonaceae bacterium]